MVPLLRETSSDYFVSVAASFDLTQCAIKLI